MKRVLGLVLAGLVGAGTLFSGVGIAHAEGEADTVDVNEVENGSNSKNSIYEDNPSEIINENLQEDLLDEEKIDETITKKQITDNSIENGDIQNSQTFDERVVSETNSKTVNEDTVDSFKEKVLSSNAVEINEENFPDDSFRSLVSNYDNNSNNILETSEIENIRYLKGNGIVNYKGIEHLYNLAYVTISMYSMYNYSEDSSLVDLSSINSLSNLKYLTLMDVEVKNIKNLEKCTSLVNLDLLGLKNDSLDISEMK